MFNEKIFRFVPILKIFLDPTITDSNLGGVHATAVIYKWQVYWQIKEKVAFK